VYAHAFVWDGERPPRDLNALVPAGAPLTLNVAYAVNEKGEIAGLGTSASGETHAFVLVPDDCVDELEASAAQLPAAPGSAVRLRSYGRVTDAIHRAGLLPQSQGW
jgi:probable HAF family extracellular repeat protein